MASTAAVLNIVVKANTTSAVSGLRKVDTVTRRTARSADTASKHASKHSKALKDVGHGAAYALGAGGLGGGLYAVFEVLHRSIDKWHEAEQVTKLTGAALRSTGGAANVTAKHIEELSMRVEKKTAIDHLAIQTSENLLLTFPKIRNEAGKNNKIFDRATVAVTNLATALNHGAAPSVDQLHSASIQLGKALQDPIKGATALRRVGVALSASQQKQIKTLVAHGHQMEAQKIILRELSTEFGKAAEKTATPSRRLQTNLSDLTEALGKGITPWLNKATARLNVFVGGMLKGTGQGGRFVKTLEGLWQAVKPTVVAFGRLAGGVAKFAAAHTGLARFAVEMGAVWLVVRKFKGFSLADSLTGGLSGSGLAGRFKGLAPRLRSIGKATLGVALAAGVMDAMSRPGLKGFDRPAQFFSDLTAGIIPPPKTISEKLKWTINQALRMGSPRAPGFTKSLTSLVDDPNLDKSGRRLVKKLVVLRQQAIRAFGPDTKLSPRVALNTAAATRGLRQLTNSFGRMKAGAVLSLGELRSETGKNMAAIERLFGTHSAAGRRAMNRNLSGAISTLKGLMADGSVSTRRGMAELERQMRVHSRKGGHVLGSNIAAAIDVVKSQMSRGGNVTDEGLKVIDRLFRSYLASYGVKGNAADFYLSTRKHPYSHDVGVTGQRGMYIAQGKPSGDSVHALLEKGEGVINRKAVAALGGPGAIHAINRMVPRFATGGVVPRQVVQGPSSPIKAIDQGGLDRTRHRANALLDKARAQMAAAGPSGGGEVSTHGLVHQVLRALAFARRHGWHGSVTSGFRSFAEQSALYARYLAGGPLAAKPGLSSHEKGQAVDVTDYGVFGAIMARAPRNSRLYNLLGAADPVHYSVSGRQRGGMVGMARGGIAGLEHAKRHRFTLPELRALWVAAGGNYHKATTMGHVAIAESGLGTGHGLPWARNPSGATGLWQILGGAGDLYDPWVNATNAVAKYRGGGLGPWAASRANWGRWANSYDKRKPALLRGPGGRRGSSRQTKLPPALPVKGLAGRLRNIRGIGLSKMMETRLKVLTAVAAKFEEYANRAETLGGKVFGHDQAYWLQDELKQLFPLRNYLIKAHNRIVALRKRIRKVLLPRARKHLHELRKHPVLNRDRIKAYTGKIIPALRSQYGKLGSRDGDLLSALSDVQGAGSSMRVMRNLPPVGELGGSIFDTQAKLKELGAKDTTTDTGAAEPPERLQSIIDLLKEQLQQANLGKAVSEGAFQVFRDMPSFQTMPGQWHTVPGPYNQPMAAVVHGGERIGRPGDTNVQVYVHPGGAGADVRVNGEWVRAEVRKVLRSEVSRVGRTPARAGT